MIQTDRAAPVWTRRSLGLFTLVLLLFVAARWWRLTSSCLWFDEIFSVHAARHGWSELLKFVAADIIHPPLFYALLKIWIAIGGESLLWVRLFPALISIAALVPVCLLCRELKLAPSVTNLAIFLMAVSGFLIKYSQEVRMYSLVFLFTAFSIWAFLKFLDRSAGKFFWLLGAVNLLLVYTHYYGWILVTVEAVIILIWNRSQLPKFAILLSGLAVAYVPWLYEVWVSRTVNHGLAQNVGWIARPGLRDVARYFVLLSQPFQSPQSNTQLRLNLLVGALVVLVFGVPFMLFCRRAFHTRPFPRTEKVLLMFVFAPLGITLVLSWVLPYSIWGARHLIICAPALLILLAIAIARLARYWMKVAVLLILGCGCLVAGAVSVITPAPAFSWCAWQQLLPQVATGDSSKPIEIYTPEDLIAYHLWYAATQTGKRLNVIILKHSGVPEDQAYFLPRRFDEIKTIDQSQLTSAHFWLAFRATDWDETRAPLSVMKADGYKTGRVFSIQAQDEQAFLVELLRGP